MYCPRCGRQPVADELRFCSYCGFKLGVVKASLADNEETILSDTRAVPGLPRQRDINIGVILMFADAVFVSFLAGGIGPGISREAAAVVLAAMYVLILLFSRPITKSILKLLSWDESPDANFRASWKGMGFGATLMFLSTIGLAIGSLLIQGRMRTTPFFIGLLLAFTLLMVGGRYLMRALRYLVAEDSTVSSNSLAMSDHAAPLSPAFEAPALQPGQDPIPVFGSQRIKTAEIVSPSSITEHTTNLLE